MLRKLILVLFLSAGLIMAAGANSIAEDLIFDFEESSQGWYVPDWALEKDDNASMEVDISDAFSSQGKKALCLVTNFPGSKWAAAVVEVAEYYDWTPYKKISVDIYIPSNAPAGLTAQFVLTVGEDWVWTEARRNVRLTPGQWTTISVSLAPGNKDWRRTIVDENFRKDIRKVLIRIASNNPAYSGNIYIDNIRLD